MARRRVLLPLVAVLASTAFMCGKSEQVESAGATAAAKSPKVAQVPKALAAKVKLEPIVRKLDRPVALVQAPGDGPERLFVVEQHVARIRILRGDQIDETPFLDLGGRVSKGSEQGLLGLAFHPKYADNGRLFVNYTDRDGDTHITEFKVSAKSRDLVDAASEKDLLKVDQPYANHNGGHLLFGPDGLLYVGLGDGGAGGDPQGNGQDPKALLGKMLRLDVDAAQPKPEIWQIGLRNPWRYAFDKKTGDLYLADVGQNLWEEVDVVPASSKGGENFGWNVMEGFHCYDAKTCKTDGLALPVVEYDHKTGCSITGGYVYRGKAIPELDGAYFYADYCTAIVRSFRWSAGGSPAIADHWEWRPVLDPKSKLASISSFGEDSDGELYLLSLDGIVYKLVRK